MELEDLSAADLRLVDEICLAFESRARRGEAESIESTLERYRQLAGSVSADHLDCVRRELVAISAELEGANDGDETPFDSSTASNGTLSEQESGFDSIGPYSVSRVVARGGMGVVYKAFDTRLDRPVAIKVIGLAAPDHDKHQEIVERFEREARAVAALSHPNIVELYDVGTENGRPYAVMEYLRGRTLAVDFGQGAMSSAKTRAIGMQIAGALATAHAGGVIHRDLKPQNIMVVEDGTSGETIRVKLVDFGLSRVNQTGWSDNKSDRTRLGTILGTPGYMSPEQARGEPTRNAADVFGLGCILYEAFVGERAIPGATPADRLAATLTGSVVFPRERLDEDPSLCRLIELMLSKAASERPTSDAIYQRLRAEESAVDSVSQQDFKRALDRRTWIAASATGVAAGAAGLVWMFNPFAKREKIQSVAVLTFRLADHAGTDDPAQNGAPLAGRRLTDGEAIAAALSKALSRIRELSVRPFRPRVALSDVDLPAIARELGVDALVTGSYRIAEQNGQTVSVLDWRLVNSEGDVLVTDRFVNGYDEEDIGQRLLNQEALASKIAEQMDHVLAANELAIGASAYSCLVKGRTQADVDSVMGLRKALMCFEKARKECTDIVEPIGAFAVTAINLAARTDREEADECVSEAIATMREAIKKDPKAVDGLLAQAIIEWQIFYEFGDARILLKMLAEDYKFNWQIQHQFGLLMATLGRFDEATRALRWASTLHPDALLIKVDRCRVDWYSGDTEGAIEAALRYQKKYGEAEHERTLLPRGLLIDIYEQQKRWDLAAAEQGWLTIPATASDYFDAREGHLEEHPYGPFGELLNRAIFELRRSPQTARSRVGDLSESRSPMFPMLVNLHPAFASVRRLYEGQSGSPAPFLVAEMI